MKTKTTKPPKQLDTAALVDELGSILAIMSDFSKKKAELVKELLARAGNDKYLDGNLYTATIVAECTSSILDIVAISKEMGEEWITSHSKDTIRKASVRVTARKTEKKKARAKL